MRHDHQTPSAWIERWGRLLKPGATVLDVACGYGRHTRLFAARGCKVLALDRDAEALAGLEGIEGVQILHADIENAPWPLDGQGFDAVVVVNYLHRPLWPSLVAAVAPGGLLLYETFMQGNERYGKPSNPAFLLRPGELLEATTPLQPLAFEQGTQGGQAVIQRICALRGEPGSLDLSQAL